jgi:hypothetical protein
MLFTLQIYRCGNNPHAILHHQQVFDLPTESDAAMVLVATREGLPRGFMAGMTFSRHGTTTNVRIKES